MEYKDDIRRHNSMTLRMVELFAGIGAQAMAMRGLGVDCESTVCEIDRFAYKAYCAIHGDTPNLGDITKVERLPECDIVTYSYPCQDCSISNTSGKGMGEGSGTRSSLVWEVGRLLDTAKADGWLPEYLVMENVDAILNRRNRPDFDRWCAKLEGLGYTNSWKVLNAKDYGTPQNRRRVFMVSALGNRSFVFPEPCPDGRVLRDVLEPEEDVDPSLYMSRERIARYEEHRLRHEAEGHGFGWRPAEPVGVAHTVNCNPTRHSQNFVVVHGHVPAPYEQCGRVYGTEGIAPTMVTGAGGGHIAKIDVTAEDVRIRMLSPREAWRLMDFPDWAFDRARDAGLSKSRLYRLAGNSICVCVLEAIFRDMLAGRFERVPPRVTLDDFGEGMRIPSREGSA